MTMLFDDGYDPPLCPLCPKLMVRAPGWDHVSRTGHKIVFACHDCATVDIVAARKEPLPIAA